MQLLDWKHYEKLSINMVSEIVQSLLPLSNQIPIWTLDKIGIPEFRFPIGTYSPNITLSYGTVEAGDVPSSMLAYAELTSACAQRYIFFVLFHDFSRNIR